MSAIVVDYEELHRMAAVWAETSKSLAKQALAVASMTAESSVLTNAVFDPLGATRVETSIVAAATVPHGLAALAARLAADSLALEAVVRKEQLIDDFPLRELAAFDAWLLTAAVRFPFAPAKTLRAGEADAAVLADAMVGYLAPFTAPLLSSFAPAAGFRADVAGRRPLALEPFFGLPLALVGSVAPEGPGYAVRSSLRPPWAGTAPAGIGSVLRRIADLEDAPAASLAIDRVVGRDGIARYVIELPGMRHMGIASDPQDLSGSISAMVLPATAYTRAVSQALDAVGVPRGAQVMLVGHSEGGIVAMDLAGDPSFNGGRVQVTHVVAAGAPITSKQVASGSDTQVFSVENVNDIVTHLDAVDAAAPETVARLTYQFSADDHDVVRSHDPTLYAERVDALADSPNPLLRRFQAGAAVYFSGASTTSVFTLADAPPG